MAGLISAVRNWRERRGILRQFHRENANQRELNYFKVQDDLNDALSALIQNDHRHAAELWATAMQRSPRDAHASPLALRVLLPLRRFDEAETIMRQGHAKYPSEIRYAAGLAEVARARGDDAEALLRWAAVRKRFPNAMIGHASAAEALRNLKRLPEAEAMAEQTMKRFPEEVLGFMEHARLADLRVDWEQSRQRWDLVRTRFDHPSGYTAVGHALIELGRFDEAEAMLAAARIRSPTETMTIIELARCAKARGDTPTALGGWQHIARAFPLHLPTCLTAAGALESLDAPADAETVLRQAADHFPGERVPIEQLGLLLVRRGDFDGAVEAFVTMRRTFPDDPVARMRLVEALTLAGRSAEAEAARDQWALVNPATAS